MIQRAKERTAAFRRDVSPEEAPLGSRPARVERRAAGGSRQSSLLRALGLACLPVLASCRGCIGCSDPIGLDTDALIQILVLHFFAAFFFLVSLVGIGFAVRHMALRRRRSFVSIVVSIPFAVMAIWQHATATDGFTHVDDQTFIHAWRLMPVHLSMGWLLALLGAPLVWLAVTIVDAALAPPPAPKRRPPAGQPTTPPLTARKALIVVLPITLLLAAYASLFVRRTDPARPTSLPASKAIGTATSGTATPVPGRFE